jgi:hypothetical protein
MSDVMETLKQGTGLAVTRLEPAIEARRAS